jgi:hypothetical protein
LEWIGQGGVDLGAAVRKRVQTVAAASSDPVATILADQLAELRRLLMEAFPHATAFVRPGFDELWR